MNEAKASYNAYFLDPRGNKVQITLRDENERTLMERVLQLNQDLNNTYHYKPFTSGEVAQKQNGSHDSVKSFKVETIELAAGGDNPRWVVKGGNFKKFGVTCWPETLEESGIHNLDPLKDNKPKVDVVAYYSERTNDEGKVVPDKVIRLERKK